MDGREREIRVFVSSTFLDMHGERDYLNKKVFPLFEDACSKRGVSFFAVDLRWGITREQSEREETLALCMRQIGQCVPFFIGLIGNRYGWIPDYQSLSDEFPWLSGSGCMSATEFEFRSYFSKAKNDGRCLFAQKAPELMDEVTSDGKANEIAGLLDLVASKTGQHPFIYRSMEELGSCILSFLESTLDELYPSDEDTLEHQLALYRNVLLSYDDSLQLSRLERENIDRSGNPFRYARHDPSDGELLELSVTYCSSDIGMMYTEPGTTPLCDRLILSTMSCHPGFKNTIFVFLEASDRLRNAVGMLSYLLDQLRRYVPPERVGAFHGSMSTPSDYAWAITRMLEMIPDRITIFITGLHLLRQCSSWDYLLPYFSLIRPNRADFVLISEDEVQGALFEGQGMLLRHFVVDDIAAGERGAILGVFLRRLEHKGKNLDMRVIEELYDSGALKDYSSAVFLEEYLSNYVMRRDLEETIGSISSLVSNGATVFDAVWEIVSSKASLRASELACEMLCLIDALLLRESDLQHLLSEAFGTTKYEFECAFEIVRPFTVLRGDGLWLRSIECRVGTMAHTPAKPIETELGTSVVEWVLERHVVLWAGEMHALCSLIRSSIAEEKAAISLMKMVVSNRAFLNLANDKDWHLLRSSWAWLYERGALDLRELYPELSSYDGPMSLYVYDMMMCAEHDVTGGNIVEAFLDIPSFYSTDFEHREKDDSLYWRVYDSIELIPVTTKEMSAEEAIQEVKKIARQGDGVSPRILAYGLEALCKALFARGELRRNAVQLYLNAACANNNPRQAYDALRYLRDLPMEGMSSYSRERARRCNTASLSALSIYA